MKRLNYIWMCLMCNALKKKGKGLCLKGFSLVMMIFLLSGLAACSHDDEPDDAELKGDVVVYVNLLATRSGDPGSAHEEDQMQWDNLRIFLLYDNGRVAEHTLTRTQYDQLADKNIRFRAPVGKAFVYAVAYTGKISIQSCTTAGQVRNLTTGDMAATNITKTDWINLFSGKNPVEMSITPDGKGKTIVTLKRLVAKIDVQYDVQEGLDGMYQNITMNQIDFFGPTKGYFFPEEATEPDWGVGSIPVTTSVCSDPVSRRNGRQYFYTFPTRENASKHKFDFKLTYTPREGSADAINGEKTYTFSFNTSPQATQWYKVNLTVKGNNITDTNLVLTPNLN